MNSQEMKQKWSAAEIEKKKEGKMRINVNDSVGMDGSVLFCLLMFETKPQTGHNELVRINLAHSAVSQGKFQSWKRRGRATTMATSNIQFYVELQTVIKRIVDDIYASLIT